MRKTKVVIEDLAYCGGCEVAIADIGEPLVDILKDQIDLEYAPVLMSRRDYGDCDIGIVIGAVRSDHDMKLAKKVREKSKVLVALGSCACFGGIPSLANMSAKEDLLNTAYRDAPSISSNGSKEPPRERVPSLLEHVKPVNDYVNVDFQIPGCPPPPRLIADVISTLLKAYKPREEVGA